MLSIFVALIIVALAILAFLPKRLASGEVQNEKFVMGADPHYLRELYPGAYESVTPQTTVKGYNITRTLGELFLLIQYEDFVQAYENAELMRVTDPHVVCVIGVYDPERCEELDEFLAESYGIRTIFVEDYDPTGDEMVAIIGAPFDGMFRYEFSCPHVFWDQDMAKLVSTFTSREVAHDEYVRYLMANRNLLAEYKEVTLSQLGPMIKFWLGQ